MNIIDTIFLIFTFVLAVYGFIKGFLCFLTKIAAIVFTIVLCYIFGYYSTNLFIVELGLSATVAKILSYVIFFLIVVILLKIFSVYIHKVINFLEIGVYNRFLGSVFMIFLFLVVIVLVLVGLRVFFDYNLLLNPTVASAKIVQILSGIMQRVYPGLM